MTKSAWFYLDDPDYNVEVDDDLSQRLVVEFVYQGGRRWDREVAIATDCYERHVADPRLSRSVRNAIDSLATFYDTYQRFRRRFRRSSEVYSTLWTHLIPMIGMDHPNDISRLFLTRVYQQHLSLERSRPGTRDFWWSEHIYQLHATLEELKEFHRTLKGFVSRLGKQLDNISITDLREYTESVWRQTIADQSYGVKTCFFSSPLLAGPNDSILVMDDHLGNPEVTFLPGTPRRFAVIGIGTVSTEEFEIRAINLERRPGRTSTRGFLYPRWVRILLFVTPNGQLYFPGEQLTIRRAFQRYKNSDKLHEFFRLLLLLHLHDLTKPAEVVDRLPSIFEAEKTVVGSGLLGLRRRQKPDFKTLVLPRTKPLDYPPIDVGPQQRFVDRHRVVWFVRRLPHGYHASERAITYAAEHGVQLTEGYTIVREHWRGREPEDRRLARVKYKR